MISTRRTVACMHLAEKRYGPSVHEIHTPAALFSGDLREVTVCVLSGWLELRTVNYLSKKLSLLSHARESVGSSVRRSSL